MRSRLALLLSLAWVAGCEQPRSRSPQPPPPTVAAPPHVVKPRCPEHPSIAAWERRLRSPEAKDETRRGLARGEKYLRRIRRILTDAGVSQRLALLPLVESQFDPYARGRFEERGLWQLRRVTAEQFGLVVEARHDDRLHPARATRAAARYLRYLHNRYHNWPLALAAYNAGVRRLDRALALHPRASFWQLADERRLPRITRDYVPRFIALVRIVEGIQRCPSPLV
jgi:membrane-bound lytic murein transglycosylase D